jgi:putative Mg2+ transporter-C (MgtC) family protein
MVSTLVKLLVALVVGILIGWEREYHEKAAGLRVISLVCMGAMVFTLYGGVSGNKFVNPQVAAGVVTGIGFLGLESFFASAVR